MKGQIFISASTFAKHGDQPLKLLDRSGLSYRINSLGRRLTADELMDMGGDCEGAIAGLEPFNSQVIESMPKLKCISRLGVGIDNIDLDKAKQRGIAVRNTPDVVSQPVAELTVGFAFDLLKRVSVQTASLKAGRWEKKTGNLLSEQTFGIIGLGRIGRRTAELIRSLGAKVYGCDIAPDLDWAKQAGVKIIALDQLLLACDIVSIHITFREDAPFVLGKKEISSMKKGAMLINVARGQFVDENALYDALKDGHLAGAGLDVFGQEPYKGKLCDIENIVLTPHVATLTKESRIQMELEATQNLIRFFETNK
ncbi:MAG: phosphoglycerate dehydrogenase [Candidatus Omnitrophica bacterium]|nr:phosphoglycerate dehydrogenase [Candidatus Omnitrophota bacterium]